MIRLRSHAKQTATRPKASSTQTEIITFLGRGKREETQEKEKREESPADAAAPTTCTRGVKHDPYRAGLKPHVWHGGLGISQAQASIMRAGSV